MIVCIIEGHRHRIIMKGDGCARYAIARYLRAEQSMLTYIFQYGNGSVSDSGVFMFARNLECESGSYRIQWIC